MDAKVGDIVRFFDGNFDWSGVVGVIEDNTQNKYVPHASLTVWDGQNNMFHRVLFDGKYGFREKPNPESFTIVKIGEHKAPGTKHVIDKCVKFLEKVNKEQEGTVQGKHLKRLEFESKPEMALEPNRKYTGQEIMAYVKTKKEWVRIHRTSAKMAFFDGGRCKISSITQVKVV